jgi:hypothetical protein
MWKYLESHNIHQDIINRAKADNWQFTESIQPGQVSVADALLESYEAYKKVKKR